MQYAQTIPRPRIRNPLKISTKHILLASVAFTGCAAVSLFVFNMTHLAMAAATSSSATGSFQMPQSIVPIGPYTEKLLIDLNNESLRALAVGDIHRSFFSVTGKIVALEGDNVQVFEYASSREASSEASHYLESAKKEAVWKNGSHLYAIDNLLILYMGSRKAIIDGLDKVAGPAYL
jgi:hypothetical protein